MKIKNLGFYIPFAIVLAVFMPYVLIIVAIIVAPYLVMALLGRLFDEFK